MIMRIVYGLILSMRPKQWTKNLIIYFALFFTVGDAWSLELINGLLPLLGRSTIAFFIFCVLGGGIYLINDSRDITEDRNHPEKRNRPIPLGLVSVRVAWTTAVGLLTLGLGLSFLLEPLFGFVSVTYVVLMIMYTVLLKHLVILDVFSISGGFIIRAVAGAIVIDVPISPWLYACTGLGALLIALSKRRTELSLAGGNAQNQRKILAAYSVRVLDQYISVAAMSTLVAYVVYSVTAPNLPDNHAMMLTIPFVVFGMFRYIYLVQVQERGENPEDVLLSDAPLLISIVLWLAVSLAVLSLF